MHKQGHRDSHRRQRRRRAGHAQEAQGDVRAVGLNGQEHALLRPLPTEPLGTQVVVSLELQELLAGLERVRHVNLQGAHGARTRARSGDQSLKLGATSTWAGSVLRRSEPNSNCRVIRGTARGD